MYKDENNLLFNGDCLEVMDKMIGERVKVDVIICDPPYQTTACSWDTLIPFNNHLMLPKTKRSKKLVPVYRDEYVLRELKEGREYEEICKYFDDNCREGMWQKLNKLIKDNGAIVLFGSEPFSSALRMSNIKNYKYDWIWEKDQGSNFMLAKKQPLKNHENISLFYKKQPTYNPQMVDVGKSWKKKDTGKNKVLHLEKQEKILNKKSNGNLRYPKSIQKFNRARTGIHPTQKPVALMEYLVKTYTNENEVVLDFTMGSGTTGVACKNLNRKFIGIELDEGYFEIAKERIISTEKEGVSNVK